MPGVSVRLSLARWVPLPADSLLPFVQSAVSVDASVHTDGWKGYDRLSRLGYDHRPRWQTTAPKGEQLLPRAHRASRISRPGCTALTAGRQASSYPSTWMSMSSVTTDAPTHTPRSRPSSAQHPSPAEQLPADHRSRGLKLNGNDRYAIARFGKVAAGSVDRGAGALRLWVAEVVRQSEAREAGEDYTIEVAHLRWAAKRSKASSRYSTRRMCAVIT